MICRKFNLQGVIVKSSLNKLFGVSSAALLLGAVSVIAASATANETPEILSTATPRDGTEVVQLKEQWKITEARLDDTGDLVGLIGSVFKHANDNLLMLDVQLNLVWEFDRDGNIIGSYGREGQGPGELERPAQVLNDNTGQVAIVESIPAVIELFDEEGNTASSITPDLTGSNPAITKCQLSNDFYAMTYVARDFSEGIFTTRNGLLTLDFTGKSLSTIASHTAERDMRSASVLDEEEMTWLGDRWLVTPAGDIYAVNGYRGYEVSKYDRNGKISLRFGREYNSVERDKATYDEIDGQFAALASRSPNITHAVSKYYKDVISITRRPDGEIWVQPSDGKWNLGEGILAEFDAFDENGRYLRRVVLKGKGDPVSDRLHILPDRLVVICDFNTRAGRLANRAMTESESDIEDDEFPLIICYQL